MNRAIGNIALASWMLLGLTSCAGFDDSYYPSNSGYNSGSSYDRDYYRRERQQYREQRELDRERDELEDEREEFEKEKEQYNRSPPPPPSRVQEHCPSGFSPSENKCTQAERKKGCKDMRLPGGLGCVRR